MRKEKTISHNSIMEILLFLFGFFLMMQKNIAGVNFSFSDIFILIIAMIALLKRKNKINMLTIVIISLFISLEMLNSFFIVYTIPIVVPLRLIFSGIIKFIVTIFYFIAGINIFNKLETNSIFKGFLYSGIVTSLVGIGTYFYRIPILNDIFSFQFGSRYVGLMSDANYLAVMLCSTIPIILETKIIEKKLYKLICLLITVLGIITTGSKTGLVLILVYFFYRSFIIKFSFKKFLLAGSISIVIAIIFIYTGPDILHFIENKIPNGIRLVSIFTETNALSEGGSSRIAAWDSGFELIKLFPMFGIGFGMYQFLGMYYNGTDLLAHNTYIQLFAEWGILIASVFFLYVAYSIFISKREMYIKDIMIIFLVSFLSISLNNARLFWLLLGALNRRD